MAGIKPFGIIDTIIVNSNTGDIAYFKQKSRSNLREFQNETSKRYLDKNAVVTFHDDYMFLGRTTKIEQLTRHTVDIINIIQKHELKEK